MTAQTDAPFWQTKDMDEMTPEEWESLCDGCGKCCLQKVMADKDDSWFETNVACRLLDLKTARCRNYANRKRLVPDCVIISPETVPYLNWLPETCGYVKVYHGEDLDWWHPLVSGDPDTVHEAGISVRHKAISERTAGDLKDYVTRHVRPGRTYPEDKQFPSRTGERVVKKP